MTIAKEENVQNHTEKSWAENNITFMCSGNKPETLQYEQYVIGNTQGIKVRGRTGSAMTHYTIVMRNGNDIWSFEVEDTYCDGGGLPDESNSRYKSHNEIIDRVLATFQITN